MYNKQILPALLSFIQLIFIKLPLQLLVAGVGCGAWDTAGTKRDHTLGLAGIHLLAEKGDETITKWKDKIEKTVSLRWRYTLGENESREDSRRAKFKKKCAILNRVVKEGVHEKGVFEHRFKGAERATFQK